MSSPLQLLPIHFDANIIHHVFRYILTRWVEKMIPLRRLTTIVMRHKSAKAELRSQPNQTRCLVLYCVAMSCVIFCCLVLSYLILPRLGLSCLILFCVVLCYVMFSCLVCLVFSSLVLFLSSLVLV